MPFQLSPGVLVTETDLTSVVPAVSASRGAFAGVFTWGPVMDPTAISSENQLVARFGKPVDANARSFFTAANFLSYSGDMMVVRVDTENSGTSVAVPTGSITGAVIIDGGADYTAPVVTIGPPDVEGGIQATATAVVTDGEIVEIVMTNQGSGYSSIPTINITDEDGAGFAGTATILFGRFKIRNEDEYYNNFVEGSGLVGPFAAKYPGAAGNSITISVADSATFANWAYRNEFDGAPGTSDFVDQRGGADDEMHIIVIDTQGVWTGTANSILEKYSFVSKASDARKADGTNNFYRDVINNSSKYVWWTDHVISGSNWGSPALDREFDVMTLSYTVALTGGLDDLDADDNDYINGFAIFRNAEVYDISLIPTGGVSATVAKYVVENVAEYRKDCVAFVSPVDVDTGEVIMGVDAVEKVVEFRTASDFNVNSSYGVLDSGYKYQYDRYNDKYRWVPLNGDVAGLCARTDNTNDAWWSPGGLNRGQIKSVVRLAINPDKSERDELYKNGINPVVSFPGQGTVLFGDKTLLAKPSAFDRINVRRLFIVLEKAIATAARFQLFEFNDPFTRAQFKSLVEPFLRDVQGRRGITDFKVICDENNNTGEIIDRNEFVADIYIKPARSINFITLNFIAARTGIAFEEIGA